MRAIAAAADQCPVSAFTENQIQRADQNGLSRSGFSRDNVVTWLQLKREVRNQSQVFDAQSRQHVSRIL